METYKVNGWTVHEDIDPLIPLKDMGFKTDEEQIELKQMPITWVDPIIKDPIDRLILENLITNFDS